MIKIQRWRPDTCKCIIEQTFDYTTDPAVLVSQVMIQACPFHSQPNEVLVENTMKNKGVTKVTEVLGVNSDMVLFTIDTNRQIILTPAKTLSIAEKATLNSELAKISPKLKVI